jgi:hypothetical protein
MEAALCLGQLRTLRELYCPLTSSPQPDPSTVSVGYALTSHPQTAHDHRSLHVRVVLRVRVLGSSSRPSLRWSPRTPFHTRRYPSCDVGGTGAESRGSAPVIHRTTGEPRGNLLVTRHAFWPTRSHDCTDASAQNSFLRSSAMVYRIEISAMTRLSSLIKLAEPQDPSLISHPCHSRSRK